MTHPTHSLQRAPRLALPALLLGAVGIAFAPLFVRFSDVGPVVTAGYRMIIALPVLAMMCWHTTGFKKSPLTALRFPRETTRLMLLAACCFSADLGIWHWSLQFTTVANATLLSNAAPVFVTLGAWLVFGQKPRLVFVLGMTAAMAGAATLLGESLWTSKLRLQGDLMALVTAVFYGSYILILGKLRLSLNTASLMFWNTLLSAIILFPVAWISGEVMVPASAQGWWVLLGLALVSQVAGQSLIAYAMAHLPPAFGSVTLLSQPAMAAAMAWVMLGEALSPWQMAGGAVIVAGIFLARKGTR